MEWEENTTDVNVKGRVDVRCQKVIVSGYGSWGLAGRDFRRSLHRAMNSANEIELLGIRKTSPALGQQRLTLHKWKDRTILCELSYSLSCILRKHWMTFGDSMSHWMELQKQTQRSQTQQECS